MHGCRLVRTQLPCQLSKVQTTGVAQCTSAVGPSTPFWSFGTVAAVAAAGRSSFLWYDVSDMEGQINTHDSLRAASFWRLPSQSRP